MSNEDLQLDQTITETNQNKNVEDNYSSANLDTKVNNFIEWYFNNMCKGKYTKLGEYYYPIRMRNFIEKMAVWYELRYPDYEINRLMYCCGQEKNNINDVMFKNNPYINDLLDENSEAKDLCWDEFYNTSVFIKSLPIEERSLLARPWYGSISTLIPTEKAPFNLELTRNGFVKEAENVSVWTNSIVKDEELIGMHVRKVVELFKNRDINLPENSDLEEIITNVDKQLYCKEELLNCVMYRIIDRGGNRIGPRRAFLFAKEFGRNIDIPMMYAVNYADPGLRSFINEYIKNGGSKDLECYAEYFFRINKNEKLDTVTIQDLIIKIRNNALSFYTPEETKLHQRLANAIASQVDQEKVKKEKVKELRIKRKLKKLHKKS